MASYAEVVAHAVSVWQGDRCPHGVPTGDWYGPDILCGVCEAEGEREFAMADAEAPEVAEAPEFAVEDEFPWPWPDLL